MVNHDAMIISKPKKGHLLIAEPSIIGDISFNRSVILLADYNEAGSIGFILNKPLEYTLNELIPETNSTFKVHNGGPGWIELKRGLIEVSGSEAIQFLNGLITNDVGALEDGEMMLAAFPNVKGRMPAIVRVLRRGDSFFFETEEAWI